MFKFHFQYFTPYQARWKNDRNPLRLCVKGRQIGLSHVDQYDSVLKAATKKGRDVWIMSRDEVQSHQYFLGCKRWARVLGYAARDLGEQIFTTANGKPIKVRVLTFASGATIYALSSNPDAIVGKSGHVKLDEFALHKDQRTLYSVAKPVIQWGGTLSIISTHRGPGTLFNQLITEIKHGGNPMGWSLHEIPIQKAVDEGLVEKINTLSGRKESREAWLARQRAECIDEEQWLQEYCCIPASENSAFLSYELLNACEDPTLKLFTFAELLAFLLAHPDVQAYLGIDVARRGDLCVFDLGLKIGDLMWDRLRLDLQDKTFTELEFELYRLLRLPQLRRCCIDSTSIGIQLSEQAQERFGSKVEPIVFTSRIKEQMAFALRGDFEDRRLRIPHDDKLRADLRGIKQETTPSGTIRFEGEAEDSHCDRFWAKALRQHAARARNEMGAMVG